MSRNLGYGIPNGVMLRNQLLSIKRVAQELYDATMDSDELPDWVLSKVTVALDRLEVATNYIVSKLEGYKMNPYDDVDIDAEVDKAEQLKELIMTRYNPTSDIDSESDEYYEEESSFDESSFDESSEDYSSEDYSSEDYSSEEEYDYDDE